MFISKQNIQLLFSGNTIKLLVRILVTLSIFVLILHSIDIQQVWTILKQVRLDMLAVAILVQFSSTTVAAYRWQLIMHNLHFGQSFLFYWHSYFKAMFFNQGLPTSIGGDALRVFDVAAQGFRKRDALYGIVLDRVSGLAALMLLNLLAYVSNPDLLPIQVYHVTLVLIIIGAIVVVFVASLKYLRWLDNYPQLAIVKAISTRLHQAFLCNRTLLFVSSLLIPLLAILVFFIIGQALNLRYDPMTYFVIVPPAIYLTIIPISVAGWGVREGALVGLFSLIGADKPTVLAMSIIYGFTLIIISLPGLVIYLKGRHRVI
ncbi:MAG: flippase-like domain-containing protein [Gammaproteobacteria bacterium]|nr:flippase-like domain-containing protein [Candidatus Competibacteraceae bacterium]MCP5195198.1 flippase-like domain-containing protein [Gammaproteobacteria bacterium]